MLRNEGARVFTNLKCLKNMMVVVIFYPVIPKSTGFFLSLRVMFVLYLVKFCWEMMVLGVFPDRTVAKNPNQTYQRVINQKWSNCQSKRAINSTIPLVVYTSSSNERPAFNASVSDHIFCYKNIFTSFISAYSSRESIYSTGIFKCIKHSGSSVIIAYF